MLHSASHRCRKLPALPYFRCKKLEFLWTFIFRQNSTGKSNFLTSAHVLIRRAEMPARSSSSFIVHPLARSWNLTPAAPSPACAAAAATRAASATTHSAATAATAATATTATPANNNGGELHVAASVFLIEEIERCKADVGHFLFAKNEALIGRDFVRLRDISSGYRARGCASCQRKTQSGRTECRYGGGFGCARVLCSLLHPWHGRVLSQVVVKGQLDIASGPVRVECDLAYPVPLCARAFFEVQLMRELPADG